MGILKSWLLFFCLVACAFCSGQDAALAGLKKQFDVYRQQTLQEKLYVHTDKKTYVAGELLWVKLYIVDAVTRTAMDVSKVAYLEILDKANRAVAQLKVPLVDGHGNSSVLVPLGTATGQYSLRAYTAWMKNFGPEHFFQMPITIINTLKNDAPVTNDSDAGYDAQFYPEGGDLVNGLQSTVAMQVTAPANDISFVATIVTDKGDSITTVHSRVGGAARFLLTPIAGQTYSARIKFASGRSLEKDLTQAAAAGYVMHLVTEPTGAMAVAVATNSNAADRVLYLLAHNRNHLQQALFQPVKNGTAKFTIDTALLAEGITHFTVCNEARQPVCERLYFKKLQRQPLLSLASDQAQYGTRKKVTLSLQTIDTTTLSDLSLAVFKTDSLAQTGADIASYLWLTSELRGYVQNPAYYFSEDAAVADATENLLLTHGWRRFRWQDVTAGPAFSFPPEVSGHLIKAVVTDGRTGQPAAGVNTYLSVPGSPFQFLASQSDSNGVALFEIKNQYGPGELIFQTNIAYDSGYRITVQPPFAQTFSDAQSLPETFSKAHTDALLQQSIGMQVQHIYRQDSLDRFRAPDAYDTIPFYGNPDYSYLLDVYTRFPTMEEVLREYVRPINVVQRRGGLHLMLFDEPRQRFFEGDELVLLDGIPLFHKDAIFSYDPLKVKKLDVITRRFFAGARFFNGVASFTTYSGNYEGLQLDPNAIVIDYDHLQLEREFYAPVYETAQQAGSRIPDFRSTLLWQPHVELKNGSATVSFYTSDMKGGYTVDVQGIDNTGRPVVARQLLEVK